MNAGVGGQRRWTWVLALSLTIALAAASYWVASEWQSGQAVFQRVSTAVECSFTEGACRQHWQDDVVLLAIEPPDVPLMRPLRLSVDLGGKEATAVHVTIRGLNMDMGLNRTTLQRDGSGRWVGETILPICSQRRMEWEAAVEVAGTEFVEIPFAFSTRR